MAIPPHCDPRNRKLPEASPDRYVPDAARVYFGAGRYRVAEAFEYNRKPYPVGVVVDLTDEEAGIFYRWIEHADPSVESEREAAARAVAASPRPSLPSPLLRWPWNS